MTVARRASVVYPVPAYQSIKVNPNGTGDATTLEEAFKLLKAAPAGYTAQYWGEIVLSPDRHIVNSAIVVPGSASVLIRAESAEYGAQILFNCDSIPGGTPMISAVGTGSYFVFENLRISAGGLVSPFASAYALVGAGNNFLTVAFRRVDTSGAWHGLVDATTAILIIEDSYVIWGVDATSVLFPSATDARLFMDRSSLVGGVGNGRLTPINVVTNIRAIFSTFQFYSTTAERMYIRAFACIFQQPDIATQNKNIRLASQMSDIRGCTFNNINFELEITSSYSVIDGCRFVTATLGTVPAYCFVILAGGCTNFSIRRCDFNGNWSSAAIVNQNTVATGIIEDCRKSGGTFTRILDDSAGGTLVLRDIDPSGNLINLTSKVDDANVRGSLGDITLDYSYATYLSSAAGGGRIITLPLSANAKFRTYIIKKTDATANTVSVSPQGGQTIDGAASYQLTLPQEYVIVQSDGSNWTVVGHGVGGTSGGGLVTGITSVAADTPLTAIHGTVLVSAAGAARTITLPNANTCKGRQYTVKKTDSSANAVNIASGGGTIDGAVSAQIVQQNASLTFQSDGTNWWIV